MGAWLSVQETTPKDSDQCARLTTALAQPECNASTYRGVFAQIQAATHLVTQACASNDSISALAERLCREQERLIPLRERRKAVAAATDQGADHHRRRVISRYQALRTGAGARLDDLIDRPWCCSRGSRAGCTTSSIRHRPCADRRAQDTSPKQWEIIAG